MIDPDLEELKRKLGGIPHLLRDPSGNIHLCTARREDVKTGRNLSTSAVASLAWAIKWICVLNYGLLEMLPQTSSRIIHFNPAAAPRFSSSHMCEAGRSAHNTRERERRAF